MNLDSVLDKSINTIYNRLSDIEGLYLQLAGKRLADISGMKHEDLTDYLYSGKFLDDVNHDLSRVKKAMKKTHRENLKNMKQLSGEIVTATHNEGMEIEEAKNDLG